MVLPRDTRDDVEDPSSVSRRLTLIPAHRGWTLRHKSADSQDPSPEENHQQRPGAEAVRGMGYNSDNRPPVLNEDYRSVGGSFLRENQHFSALRQPEQNGRRSMPRLNRERNSILRNRPRPTSVLRINPRQASVVILNNRTNPDRRIVNEDPQNENQIQRQHHHQNHRPTPIVNREHATSSYDTTGTLEGASDEELVENEEARSIDPIVEREYKMIRLLWRIALSSAILIVVVVVVATVSVVVVTKQQKNSKNGNQGVGNDVDEEALTSMSPSAVPSETPLPPWIEQKPFLQSTANEFGRAVAMSASGDRVAVASLTNVTIYQYVDNDSDNSKKEWKLVDSLPGRSVRMSSNGRTLAILHPDRTIGLYQQAGESFSPLGQPIAPIMGHIQSFVLARRGNVLAIGSAVDGPSTVVQVLRYDRLSHQIVPVHSVIDFRLGLVTHVSLSPDGSLVATGTEYQSQVKTTKVIASQGVRWREKRFLEGIGPHVALTEGLLVVGTKGSGVSIFNTDNGALHSINVDTGVPPLVAVSVGGSTVAAAWGSRVAAWRRRNNNNNHDWTALGEWSEPSEGTVSDLELMEDGTGLVVGSSSAGTVRFLAFDD